MTNQRQCYFLPNEAATLRAAELLSASVAAGDVILLIGDLGAGKTTFTRGLARGMGSPAAVSSPTFTLIHEYDGGRMPIVHVDAYRLNGPSDAETTGLTEYLNRGDSVIIIEWPERVLSALPADRLEVSLDESDDGRQMKITPKGASWSDRAAHLFSALSAEFTPC